jgi:hypothetical protein
VILFFNSFLFFEHNICFSCHVSFTLTQDLVFGWTSSEDGLSPSPWQLVACAIQDSQLNSSEACTIQIDEGLAEGAAQCVQDPKTEFSSGDPACMWSAPERTFEFKTSDTTNRIVVNYNATEFPLEIGDGNQENRVRFDLVVAFHGLHTVGLVELLKHIGHHGELGLSTLSDSNAIVLHFDTLATVTVAFEIEGPSLNKTLRLLSADSSMSLSPIGTPLSLPLANTTADVPFFAASAKTLTFEFDPAKLVTWRADYDVDNVSNVLQIHNHSQWADIPRLHLWRPQVSSMELVLLLAYRQLPEGGQIGRVVQRAVMLIDDDDLFDEQQHAIKVDLSGNNSSNSVLVHCVRQALSHIASFDFNFDKLGISSALPSLHFASNKAFRGANFAHVYKEVFGQKLDQWAEDTETQLLSKLATSLSGLNPNSTTSLIQATAGWFPQQNEIRLDFRFEEKENNVYPNPGPNQTVSPIRSTLAPRLAAALDLLPLAGSLLQQLDMSAGLANTTQTEIVGALGDIYFRAAASLSISVVIKTNTGAEISNNSKFEQMMLRQTFVQLNSGCVGASMAAPNMGAFTLAPEVSTRTATTNTPLLHPEVNEGGYVHAEVGMCLTRPERASVQTLASKMAQYGSAKIHSTWLRGRRWNVRSHLSMGHQIEKRDVRDLEYWANLPKSVKPWVILEYPNFLCGQVCDTSRRGKPKFTIDFDAQKHLLKLTTAIDEQFQLIKTHDFGLFDGVFGGADGGVKFSTFAKSFLDLRRSWTDSRSNRKLVGQPCVIAGVDICQEDQSTGKHLNSTKMRLNEFNQQMYQFLVDNSEFNGTKDHFNYWDNTNAICKLLGSSICEGVATGIALLSQTGRAFEFGGLHSKFPKGKALDDAFGKLFGRFPSFIGAIQWITSVTFSKSRTSTGSVRKLKLSTSVPQLRAGTIRICAELDVAVVNPSVVGGACIHFHLNPSGGMYCCYPPQLLDSLYFGVPSAYVLHEWADEGSQVQRQAHESPFA